MGKIAKDDRCLIMGIRTPILAVVFVLVGNVVTQ